MRSVDKLRELPVFGAVSVDGDLNATNKRMVCATKEEVLEIADEIEAEIAEYYLALPLDADGVPIRPGDKMDAGEVFAVSENPGDGAVWFTCNSGFNNGEYRCEAFRGYCHHHVKPDALKELLDDVSKGIICYPRERVTGYLEDNHSIGEAVMLDVRDRLRELLGGDAQ